MEIEQRRVFADKDGVWQQGVNEERFGIRWTEISEVSGYKIDGVTEIITNITLDFDFGESFEFHDQQPGFAETIQTITKRLRGIDPNWFDSIVKAGVQDPPLTVWTQMKKH